MNFFTCLPMKSAELDKNRLENRIFRLAIFDFDDIRNPLLNAGQARSTYEIGRRLARRGWRVEVFSSRFPGYLDRIEEGIKYRHIGLGSRWLRLNNIVYFPAALKAAGKAKADVILECFTAPISVIGTPLAAKIPVLAKATSFEAERFSKRYHLPFGLIEKIGCRRYRYFAAAAAADEEKMRRYNGKIIARIIPEGVGDEYFKIPRQKPRHILCLGRLDIGQKGLDLLLSAFQEVLGKTAWPLIVAGHGPDAGKLAELIGRRGLSERVILAGPAYGEAKQKLMREAAFVVLPSRREGFCLFALEALAAGLPVVCFDIPGLKWLTPAVSLKAEPFKGGDLASKMALYLKDEKRRQSAGQQGRALAENYSWDKAADKTDAFLREIIYNEKNNTRKREYETADNGPDDFRREPAGRACWPIRCRRFLYRAARFFDWLDLEPKPLILIFCYHAVGSGNWRHCVSREMFIRQIEYLRTKFAPISLADIGRHLKRERIISRPSFALTFDDGYRNILKISGIFEKWPAKPAVFALADPASADRAELGNEQPLLAAGDLRALAAAGWEIGCHSATHADFARLSPAGWEREIAGAKIRLEKNCGVKVRYFSYPKGVNNPGARTAVESAGYELAVTMDDGYIGPGSDPLALPRVGVDATHSWPEFSSLYRWPSLKARVIMRRLF